MAGVRDHREVKPVVIGLEGGPSGRFCQGGHERASCDNSPLARLHDNPSIRPVFVWWPITDRASLRESPRRFVGPPWALPFRSLDGLTYDVMRNTLIP
jgi:hypothetical protein